MRPLASPGCASRALATRSGDGRWFEVLGDDAGPALVIHGHASPEEGSQVEGLVEERDFLHPDGRLGRDEPGEQGVFGRPKIRCPAGYGETLPRVERGEGAIEGRIRRTEQLARVGEVESHHATGAVGPPPQRDGQDLRARALVRLDGQDGEVHEIAPQIGAGIEVPIQKAVARGDGDDRAEDPAAGRHEMVELPDERGAVGLRAVHRMDVRPARRRPVGPVHGDPADLFVGRGDELRDGLVPPSGKPFAHVPEGWAGIDGEHLDDVGDE